MPGILGVVVPVSVPSVVVEAGQGGRFGLGPFNRARRVADDEREW